MRVTLLLCDAAQEAGGKLYVHGGGWNLLQAPNIPVTMALAVLIAVPWDQANQPHQVVVQLVDDDGELVTVEGNEVVHAGQFEVGRPPGTKPGTELNTPLAFNFQGVTLPAGGYRWELLLDGTQMAIAPFRVVGD